MTTIAPTTEAWTPQAPITGLPRFLSYMRYPVFSREWFFARTKLFGTCGLLYSLLSGVSVFLIFANLSAAILSASLMWLAFMMAIATGPWLAMRARYKHYPIAKKYRRVCLAVIVGLLISGFVEIGGLAHLLSMIRHSMGLPFEPVAAGMTSNMTISVSATAALAGTRITKEVNPDFRLLVSVMALSMTVLKYAFYSGVFALPGFLSEQRRAEKAMQEHELSRLKIQKHESDQQLAILQAQIEPHFLFNTLSSVRALVKQDAERAAVMLDGLADYLRVTLPKLRTTDAVASLGEQLEICQRYLQLMQLRMGERFSYVIDVPDVLRQLQVPPLLLLPLVENAIKHGVEPKPGNVSVTITARQQDNNLLIDVSDDGVGLNVDMHAALNSLQSGQGVGLDNVRRQLQLRFGERATLDISGRAHGGVLASLSLPV